MDDFRASLNKCGCGGIRCHCCRPVDSDGKKDDTWTRHARRSLKQKVEEQIKGELEVGTYEDVLGKLRPPILSEDEREKFQGMMAAIDVMSGKVIGLASSRLELKHKMLPRVCGIDYYAYFVKGKS